VLQTPAVDIRIGHILRPFDLLNIVCDTYKGARLSFLEVKFFAKHQITSCQVYLVLLPKQAIHQEHRQTGSPAGPLSK
jgi:hypothetical protein